MPPRRKSTAPVAPMTPKRARKAAPVYESPDVGEDSGSDIDTIEPTPRRSNRIIAKTPVKTTVTSHENKAVSNKKPQVAKTPSKKPTQAAIEVTPRRSTRVAAKTPSEEQQTDHAAEATPRRSARVTTNKTPSKPATGNSVAKVALRMAFRDAGEDQGYESGDFSDSSDDGYYTADDTDFSLRSESIEANTPSSSTKATTKPQSKDPKDPRNLKPGESGLRRQLKGAISRAESLKRKNKRFPSKVNTLSKKPKRRIIPKNGTPTDIAEAQRQANQTQQENSEEPGSMKVRIQNSNQNDDDDQPTINDEQSVDLSAALDLGIGEIIDLEPGNKDDDNNQSRRSSDKRHGNGNAKDKGKSKKSSKGSDNGSQRGRQANRNGNDRENGKGNGNANVIGRRGRKAGRTEADMLEESTLGFLKGKLKPRRTLRNGKRW